MSDDELLTFRTAYRDQGCIIQRRDHDWLVRFGNGEIAVAGPWRIVQNGRIAHGSEDDHQQFGLPEPIDGEARANGLLKDRRADGLELDPVTADLRLSFDGETRLDIFNASSGSEGWQAWFDTGEGDVLIDGGDGGHVSVFPPAPVQEPEFRRVPSSMG